MLRQLRPDHRPRIQWLRRLVPLATLALMFAGMIPPATVLAAAGSVTLFHNFAGGFGGSAEAAPTLSRQFVPDASGTGNLVSIVAQCLSNNQANGCASGPATIALYTDARGSIGTLLSTSPAFQPPLFAPATGNCVEMPTPPSLVAGTPYWAVLTGGQTSWYYGNAGGFSLRIDQGSACGGHLVPNPVDGTPIEHMFARTGVQDVNTITLSNDGISDLKLLSNSISGPDAGVFSVLDADVKDPPYITHPFPQHKTLSNALGNVVILYVTCSASGDDEREFVATFTVTTDDPAQPSISWPLSCYVDNTPPSISFNFTPNGRNGWFKDSPAFFRVFGDDGPHGSGTVAISCGVNADENYRSENDGSNLDVGVTAPPAVQGLNAATLGCFATDAAHNSTPSRTSVTFSVDFQPPIISSHVTPAANAAGWHKSDVDISFSCGDPVPGSGIDPGDDTVGGGGHYTVETPFAGTIVTNTGGCEDHAGGIATSSSVTLKIDKTAPSATTITSGLPEFPLRTRETTATFALHGTDALSGIASFLCNLDSAGEVPCGSAAPSFEDLVDGPHILIVKAVDLAGNVDPAGDTLSWYVDTSPPTVTFDAPAEGGLTKGAGSVAFHATDPDDTTGFTYTCRLDTGGTASCTPSFPYSFGVTGPHSLTVVATDAVGNPGAAATVHWTVDATPPTISFTSPDEGGSVAATGSAAFSIGDPDDPTTPGAVCSLDGGTSATCTSTYSYTDLGKGQHTLVVTATDRVGNVGTGTRHFNVGGTTTTVGSSTNPSVSGQSVTFTATVTPVSGTPTGTVKFLVDGVPAGSGTVDGTGHASVTTSISAVGGRSIEADYLGDANFLASTGSVTQTVNSAGTTTALTSSQNPSATGASVTFTATVTANSPGSGTPTGSVAFLVDGSPAGSGTLDGNGKATFTTSALAIGVRSLQANYLADTNFLASDGSLTQTMIAAASLTTTFAASSVQLNGSTTLTFTLTNPSASPAMTGVGFTDTLPSGLVVATPNGVTGTCGGGTISAVAGSNSVGLSGAALAGSASCTFSLAITGTSAGVKVNTTSTVSSNEAGAGAAATATLAVVAPPVASKSFGATNVALNGTTTLSFTITNPAENGATALTGVAFTDALPAGLVVSTPNGLAGSCGGGTVGATAGSSSISLSAATLAGSGASCTFSVNVTATTEGVKSNAFAPSSTNGGAGTTANATLTVALAPQITKSFMAASILLNASTTLSFTIVNPNTTLVLDGIAFSDALPAGLVISTPNSLTGSCGGGTITAAAGSGTVALAGASLAGGVICTMSVGITGVTAGVKVNSVTVTSTVGGTGNTSSASLAVIASANLTKAFGAAAIPFGGSTSLSFTIQNPNAASSLTGIGFTDTFPAGLVVATPNGLTGSCGGGSITASAGSTSVSLVGATIAASASCTFSVNVTAVSNPGRMVNQTSAVTSANGGTGPAASATITVLAPDLTIAIHRAGNLIRGRTASYGLVIANGGPGATIGAVTVRDTLPAGVAATSAAGLGWSCSHSASAVTCMRSDSVRRGVAYPTIVIVVRPTLTAPPFGVNSALVNGGGETNTGNNFATDVALIASR